MSRQDIVTDGFQHALALAGLDKDDLASLGSGNGEDADAQAFRKWADSGNDPDLARDARMMVPVFFDEMRGKVKVWVFLGWVEMPVLLTFARWPAVRVVDQKGRDVTADVDLRFSGRWERPAYPVTAEVYVDETLDRNEFRALCDRHRTRGEILAHLR